MAVAAAAARRTGKHRMRRLSCFCTAGRGVGVTAGRSAAVMMSVSRAL
jgi:hypothetical protein